MVAASAGAGGTRRGGGSSAARRPRRHPPPHTAFATYIQAPGAHWDRGDFGWHPRHVGSHSHGGSPPVGQRRRAAALALYCAADESLVQITPVWQCAGSRGRVWAGRGRYCGRALPQQGRVQHLGRIRRTRSGRSRISGWERARAPRARASRSIGRRPARGGSERARLASFAAGGGGAGGAEPQDDDLQASVAPWMAGGQRQCAAQTTDAHNASSRTPRAASDAEVRRLRGAALHAEPLRARGRLVAGLRVQAHPARPITRWRRSRRCHRRGLLALGLLGSGDADGGSGGSCVMWHVHKSVEDTGTEVGPE